MRAQTMAVCRFAVGAALVVPALLAAVPAPNSGTQPARVSSPTPWGDTSRLGRPFSKDPSVIRFRGRYLLNYSMPPFGDGRPADGWGIGIAQSTVLGH